MLETELTTGGAGGNGCATSKYGSSSAGAGNPSGGTGGLLVIYSKNLENNGNITSEGSSSNGGTDMPGGSSGGGSINLFYDTIKEKENTKISAEGGEKITGTSVAGGEGGKGTVTKGKIENGTFVKE